METTEELIARPVSSDPARAGNPGAIPREAREPSQSPWDREATDAPVKIVERTDKFALRVPKSDFEVFTGIVRLLHDVFSRPAPLETVAARPDFRDEVVAHYERSFGTPYGGLLEPTPGHLRWFRRMEPVLRVRRGSTVLDHGGGYGINSLLLAALGYRVIFYANRLSHIAVSEFLKARLESVTGSLPMRSILADKSHAEGEPIGRIDAIVVEEATGELESMRPMLARCRRILDRHGHLFVIGANRGLGRGMRRWSALIRDAGFRPVREYAICSRWLRSERDFGSSWRGLIEVAPGVRAVAASDQVLHFAK